jgi:SAM-dependent methyltransferase
MNEIADSFGRFAEDYAQARPKYPSALYEWIVQWCYQRNAAWDCATGSGQAAVGLSPYFTRVYATDVSREQIRQAIRRENIEYSVQPAEETTFTDQSIDLVVVAQALHWFDYRRFWPEVARVARKGAFFCAWGYDWLSSTADVDELLVKPFCEIIAPFWADNNRILWNGYPDADILFPFRRVECPHFSIDLDWRLSQLLTYLCSWSAYKRSLSNARAKKALGRLITDVGKVLDPSMRLSVRMPLKLVAGRINS